MTKEEKRIVEIAEGEIEKFAKKWEKNPYLWESETDVHAEIYLKIKSSLHKAFPLDKSEKLRYKGMVKKEHFDYIYCKPKTYIKGKKNCYYPDIVIYKDENELSDEDRERLNDPMLWVCEIKYATEWSSNILDSSIENDIKKLTKLLKQKGDKTGTDSAYLLVLFRWMKTYKHEYRRKERNKKINIRLDKINKILHSFKNKKFKTRFVKKLK